MFRGGVKLNGVITPSGQVFMCGPLSVLEEERVVCDAEVVERQRMETIHVDRCRCYEVVERGKRSLRERRIAKRLRHRPVQGGAAQVVGRLGIGAVFEQRLDELRRNGTSLPTSIHTQALNEGSGRTCASWLGSNRTTLTSAPAGPGSRFGRAGS